MTQEEKQIFLRQNILDKGYDTNSFVEFMMDKKGGEDSADYKFDFRTADSKRIRML